MSGSLHAPRYEMPRLFLPALGYDSMDLSGTLALAPLCSPLGEAASVMLVSRNGTRDFQGDQAARQRVNLERAAASLGGLNLVILASNRIDELDFHHLPEESLKNLRATVDFADSLPSTDDRPVVTFHLNTLFTTREWSEAGREPDEKLEYFSAIFRHRILPALESAAQYARSRNVALKVETTPVPEFGDTADAELNSLGNPYPLYSQRGVRDLRERGFGIVLDLCHSHTLFVAARRISEGSATCDDYKGLFPADLDYLRSATLLDEVRTLEPGDMVHLNDSRGLFNRATGALHEEGVCLGDGEISDLPEIVRELVARNLPAALEIHESDYRFRPNLRRSIEYLLKHAPIH